MDRTLIGMEDMGTTAVQLIGVVSAALVGLFVGRAGAKRDAKSVEIHQPGVCQCGHSRCFHEKDEPFGCRYQHQYDDGAIRCDCQQFIDKAEVWN